MMNITIIIILITTIGDNQFNTQLKLLHTMLQLINGYISKLKILLPIIKDLNVNIYTVLGTVVK